MEKKREAAMTRARENLPGRVVERVCWVLECWEGDGKWCLLDGKEMALLTKPQAMASKSWRPDNCVCVCVCVHPLYVPPPSSISSVVFSANP